MMKNLVFFCFLVPVYLLGQNGLAVTDLTRIKSISNVQFTPDGQKIFYTLQSIEPDLKDKWDYQYTTQLWMAYTDGRTASRQITFHKDGVGSPKLSPDGKWMAFTRTVENKPQLFILPVEEGGEAWQLTTEKYGATNPVWFPDGKAVLFATSINMKDLLVDSTLNPTISLPTWPMEIAGSAPNKLSISKSIVPNPDGTVDEVKAYLNQNENDKKAKVIHKLNFQQEATVSNELSFTHLKQIEVKAGAQSVALTNGFYSFSNPQFISGTDEILVQSDMDATEHPDRSLEGEIYKLSLADHSLKKILGKQGVNYTQATVSPSGKWMACTQVIVPGVNQPSLSIMPLSGKLTDLKKLTFDRAITSIRFSDDETSLFLTAPSNGGHVVFQVNIGTNVSKPLTSVDEGISNLDFYNGTWAFVKTAIQSPSEIYLASKDFKNHTRITDHNISWLKNRTLSLPDKYTFNNEKGQTIEYWVMKPLQYQAGKKYPAILEIHGGPTAMWGPGEQSMWHEFQYYCSKGYGVVYANPRGSGGYGEQFMRSNIRDWSTGPASDVLKSLDGAIAQGWIDTSKLAITGGSYAGYLIAWIISQDHRFKAACSQRGVYDLTTFFGEGNAWRLVPNYFGGYPWQADIAKILERESPITYVHQIKTPYLIFHGENDLRTGVIQSEQLYKSLKVMGKTVEYVRHPGATHELTRSGNNRQRIDQMLRTWEFFERFIHPKP